MSNNTKGGSRKRRSPKQIMAAIKAVVIKIESVTVKVPTQMEDIQADVIADIARKTGVSKNTIRDTVSFSSVPDDVGDRLFVNCR